jgi:hypothetical protein
MAERELEWGVARVLDLIPKRMRVLVGTIFMFGMSAMIADRAGCSALNLFDLQPQGILWPAWYRESRDQDLGLTATVQGLRQCELYYKWRMSGIVLLQCLRSVPAKASGVARGELHGHFLGPVSDISC